jgi:hypothetical protein
MKSLGILYAISLLAISTKAQTSTSEAVRVTPAANTSFNQYGRYLENKEAHFLTDQVTSLEAESANGAISIHWQTGHEDGLKLFQVEYSSDGNSFQSAGTVSAANSDNGGSYRFRYEVVNTNSLTGRIYYRLKLVDTYGNWTYSKTIQSATIARAGNYIYPTFITTHTVSLFLNDPFNTVEILDISGRLLAKQVISGRTGRIDIPLPSTTAGTCIIRVAGETGTIVQKVLVDH